MTDPAPSTPTTRSCTPSQPESAEEALGDDRRGERVRAALSNLPDEQVRLVRMAFFLGLSHSQIAAETGLPLGTVKSRIRLTFGRLRAFGNDPAIDVD